MNKIIYPNPIMIICRGYFIKICNPPKDKIEATIHKPIAPTKIFCTSFDEEDLFFFSFVSIETCRRGIPYVTINIIIEMQLIINKIANGISLHPVSAGVDLFECNKNIKNNNQSA